MLRRAGPRDTDAICALLADVFPANPKADPAVLAWQYWDNPWGATSSWVEDTDGALQAHYAVIAIPGRLDGRPARAGMGVDAATRDRARGRGLFSALAKAAYASAAEEGCRVAFTAPNPYSLKGVQNAGLQRLDDLTVWVRPLDDAWLARRTHLPVPLAAVARGALFPGRGVQGLRGEEVGVPPDGLDALWARSAPGVPWGVTGDAAWWRWRFAERPRAGYRLFATRRGGDLVGAAALAEHTGYGGRFLFVLELLADDPAAAAATLAPALAEPRGAVGLAAVALPGTRLAALVRGAGLRRLPRRLEPRPLHFGVVPGGPDLPDLTRVPWSLSWSLLDHL